MPSRRFLEREADEAARRLERDVRLPPGGLHAGPVPESARRPFEQEAGVDLSDVQVDPTTSPRSVAGGVGTLAAFDGTTLFPGPLGRDASDLTRSIVAHELAHATQLATEATETSGDARSAQGRGGVRALLPLRLCVCCETDMVPRLRSGAPITGAEASGVLDNYQSMSSAERDAFVTEFHKVGVAKSGVKRLLAALDPDELSKRRALVSDLQERVQRLAAQATAGKTGEQLAQTQATFMKTEAEKAAKAAAAAEAKAKGVAPPAKVSGADIAKSHEKEVKRTSPVKTTVKNAWDALDKGPKSKKGTQEWWDAQAAVQIPRVVAACTKVAPELGITAANIAWKPREVAEAGSNVYAFSGNPIAVGMSFVETAATDPEYCVRTVVHEISGHPEFGGRFKDYAAQVYAEAHKKEKVLGDPWDTKEEKNTYGYIGTEIYAALREVPYEKKLTPAHAKAGLVIAIDPESNINNKLGLLKTKYAPSVAKALLQGLYERIRVDPRITAKALALYEKLAEKHFPGVLKK